MGAPPFQSAVDSEMRGKQANGMGSYASRRSRTLHLPPRWRPNQIASGSGVAAGAGAQLGG